MHAVGCDPCAACPPPAGKDGRLYHIIIYGASGYTGQLCLEYMLRTVVKKYPFIRWCLAGRTPEKVHKVIDKVLAMPEFAHVKYRPGVMQCSLGDATKLRRMVLSTDVVINIAGPYMKTGGEMLVEACLAYDTDYVDVNGEIPYTHKILDYHRYARQKGVFIVPNSAMVRRVTVAGMLLCVWFVAGVVTPGEGVEAERWLPCCVVLCNPHQAGGAPDTFVFYLVKLLKEKYHEKVRQSRCVVAASQGLAPSGGTLATRAAMAEARAEVGGIMANPFALGGQIGDGKRCAWPSSPPSPPTTHVV